MSTTYLVAAGLVAVALIALRFLVPFLPWRGGRSLGAVESFAVLIGVLGLAFHCGSMFDGSTVRSIPGLSGGVHTVDLLGPASIAIYSGFALVIVLGMWRLPALVAAAVAAALVAVGVTMYDGGPLDDHLTAIFVAVELIVVAVAWFAGVPRRPARVRLDRRVAGTA